MGGMGRQARCRPFRHDDACFELSCNFCGDPDSWDMAALMIGMMGMRGWAAWAAAWAGWADDGRHGRHGRRYAICAPSWVPSAEPGPRSDASFADTIGESDAARARRPC